MHCQQPESISKISTLPPGKIFADAHVFDVDMCKFESSQEDESRAQSADSSKAYRKLSGFNYCNKKLPKTREILCIRTLEMLTKSFRLVVFLKV